MAALHRQTVEQELEVLIGTSNLGGRGAKSSPNNIHVQPLFGFNMPMVGSCSFLSLMYYAAACVGMLLLVIATDMFEANSHMVAL